MLRGLGVAGHFSRLSARRFHFGGHLAERCLCAAAARDILLECGGLRACKSCIFGRQVKEGDAVEVGQALAQEWAATQHDGVPRFQALLHLST